MKQPKMPAKQGGHNTGQISEKSGFANPSNDITPNISDMQSMQNDIGEASGFQTSGYLNKKGTSYGEGAKLNQMPPGMDISNQDNADIRSMELKKITPSGYEGDGGFASRDVD